MVLQECDRLGLEKCKSADAELCRAVMSKGYLLLDSSKAASICFASLLLLLPGLEGPQRKWRGFVCLYPLNADIPKVICLMSVALQWSEPKSPCLHPQHFLPRQKERKPPVVTVHSVSSPALVPLGQKWDMCSACEKTAPSRKLRFFFSSAFPGKNVGLDLALSAAFSIQAASQWYLSRLKVTE